MSTSELDRLTNALRQDPGLRRELQALAGDPEALLACVRGKGYSLSLTELAPFIEAGDELSDEELEQAAGGEDPWSTQP